MDKPCFKCSAYDKGQDRCRVLLKLQVLPLNHPDEDQERDERLASRRTHLDELLMQRPCRFSLHVTRWAGYFINQRGLKSQDASDVHNDVVTSLLKLDFRPLAPTYDDFRRYVTAMARSAVNREYAQVYGSHCCGTCAFFLEGSKRCGCTEMKPVPGQQQIHVNYSTKPRDVIHRSMLSLSQDDILEWAGLCSRLEREGNQDAPSPGRRIWELLPVEMQGAILHSARTNGVREELKPRLVEALNELLKRQDLYQEICFRDVSHSSEAERLLEQDQQSLSPAEAQRLNRLLLEASYPEEIVQSYRGCSHYSSKRFVDVSQLDSLEALGAGEVEDTLRYMESVGPRQRKLARLLRLMLKGYEDEEGGYKIAEIARRTGSHRTTIPKELYGTTEREKDEEGEEITYRQAGAFELFRAIYTGAIFALEREGKKPWFVVNRRDFSPDAVQPGFSKISAESGIPKREAIGHYVDGWNWMKAHSTKGGGGVSRFDDDKGERKIKQTRRALPVVKASETPHPDFRVLLTYAEGDLERGVRERVAGHILVCEQCSAELEQIGTEIIPEMERPAGAAEWGRWVTRRAVGRLKRASEVADDDGGAPAASGLAWLSNRPRLHAALTYGLAVAVIALLSVPVLREPRGRRADEQLTSLSTSLDSLKRQYESLRQEYVALREQAEKNAASAEQARELLSAKQREFEQKIASLQGEHNIIRTPPAQHTPQPRPTITVKDTLGVATVGSDVVLNTPGEPGSTLKLPPALSGTVKQLVAGAVTPVKPAQDALASIREGTERGVTRGSGSAGQTRPLLLSPAFTAVRTTNQTLRWTPVPGALSYEVIVVSYQRGRENQTLVKEPVKTNTQYTGTFPQGEVYLWQVVAKVTGENGQIEEVGSPYAGFWVLDEQALRDVEAAERDYKSSALLLSGVYARYGLNEEALEQLKELKKLNPRSRFVEKMIGRVSPPSNRK
jgi:hypothetical protein